VVGAGVIGCGAVRIRRALTLAVTLAVLSGCVDVADLSFRVDKRLHWQAPDDRELIELPLTIDWTMDDFDEAAFAVFVDRAPIKPGQSLEAVAGDDDACRDDPECPDADYLAQRRVYVTTETSITIERVAPLAGRERKQLHQVVIVLLGEDGRRSGESSWSRRFRLERERF
jgi:hypothetical protein